MDPWLAAKSFSVGVAVAAPVGPMSLLCMQRTLASGRRAGLACGAGIAAADASFAALAGFGLAAMSQALIAASPWIRLAGSMLMIVLGLRIALTAPASATRPAEPNGGSGFLTAYALTLANPPTLLFFAGIFASLGQLSGPIEALTFATGVFLGSAAWWLLLTTIVLACAARLTARVMRALNLAAGAILAAYGAHGTAGALAAFRPPG